MIDLKLLRANSLTVPAAAAYVGPLSELVHDVDTNCLRLQDGVTPGGVAEFCPSTAAAFTLDPVTTGLSHTVTFSTAQTCTYWSSATGGNKNTHIPAAAAGNKGYLWIIKTTLNNGDIHNIIPLSGTVESFGTLTFNDFRASISLVSDGVSNWMVV